MVESSWEYSAIAMEIDFDFFRQVNEMGATAAKPL